MGAIGSMGKQGDPGAAGPAGAPGPPGPPGPPAAAQLAAYAAPAGAPGPTGKIHVASIKIVAFCMYSFTYDATPPTETTRQEYFSLLIKKVDLASTNA